MADETVIEIQVDDSTDEVVLPEGVIRFFAGGEQSQAETIGDLIMVGCTQRLHGFVHHAGEEPGAEVTELEAEILELFEERFGTPFEDLLDHEH